ncbi:MAG TPA: serine hydrolase [Gemmatimonadaceae bacterium]|nr:serine hydrolase [Gemmatimonadaceae bacterium]
MLALPFIALALAVAPAGSAGGRVPDDSLAARIAARIAQTPGAVVGVAFRDPERRDSLYVNADELFHAASTMKLPVMIELFRRVDAGALALEQDLLLVNQFASIVDGSPYALDSREDGDSSLYAKVGTRVPLSELIARMIDHSSNLATNALIALAGPATATRTARALGAPRIEVLRGVEDQKAFDRGLVNRTSARDLAALFEALATDRAASPASCRRMRDILLGQAYNDGIPAGLPAGTRVAHKTGDITAVNHDAGIIYPAGRGPYVLAVLTRGIEKYEDAQRLIADVARLVHAHATAGAATAAASGEARGR